jgi:GNAT superfamily N-acetyltransferase
MLRFRQVQERDLPEVAGLDQEEFSPSGTPEKTETFAVRFKTFPPGFIVLPEDGEVGAYGCFEKPSTEREPGQGQDPLTTHEPEGQILCNTRIAIRPKHRGGGFRRAVVRQPIKIAPSERCHKIILGTSHAAGLYLNRGFSTTRTP